jgi:hypothetical protein
MRRPGAAFTSTTPPRWFSIGCSTLAHHVHAADIEADHLRRFHRARSHFRMHVVGHVGGGAAGRQVGVVAQDDALAFGRHRIRFQILQRQAGQRDIVETDLGQRGRVARCRDADDVDQFAHRVLAIAHHLRRVAAPRPPACCR